MRVNARWFVLVLTLSLGAFAACSSSSSNSSSSGPDGGATSSSGGSSTSTSSSGAASSTSSSGSTAISDGGLTCTAAAGCPSTDVCCGTIPIEGGVAPNCTTGTISSTCASACATSLGTTCSGTQTVRLCATKADCTESLYNACCTFGSAADGGSLSFCANTLIGLFGGGTCN